MQPNAPHQPGQSAAVHEAKFTEGLYHIVQGDANDHADAILNLWRAGLGQNGVPQGKFSWYYQGNPAGAPSVILLKHDQFADHVGVAAIAKRPLSVFGKSMVAGEMVDFVVNQEHRSLFPAMMLMRAVHDQGLHSYGFVYGLPNSKSQAVVKRAGYTRLGDMQRYARVLRSTDYLRQRLPAALQWVASLVGPIADNVRRAQTALTGSRRRFRGEWVDAPDDRFDAIWQSFSRTHLIAGQRDQTFLRWRFVECPLRVHRFFALSVKAPKSGTSAMVAYAVCEQEGITLHVHDFLVDPSAPNAFVPLWSQLAEAAYLLGCTNVAAEFFGQTQVHRQLQRAGLVRRSVRGVCAVSTPENAAMMDAENWYMTSADEDG
jgi:hypothetical protein